MAKKYNDVVTLVRNGVELNALVAQSSQQADGEHLTVIYLDPAFDSPLLGGSTLQRAVATAFVGPLKDGAVNGWKPEGGTFATGSSEPSAADLDAHSEEQKIAAETAGTGEPTSSPDAGAATEAGGDGEASPADSDKLS